MMVANIDYYRPRLYKKQKEAIFSPARVVVIEASTKSGKTSGCLVWLFEQALKGRPGWVYWWVAPVFSQSRMAFRRLKLALPPGIIKVNESELSITLPNGAIIFFKSGDHPDSLYGEDVHAAVVDEASRCKEEVWHAVRTTLAATRGPIRIIGNVRGRKNWAYRLARQAEEGRDPEMAYFRLTAWDAVQAGILSQEEVEDARKVLPEFVFRELFMAEASDDGGNPFGLQAIEECIAPLSLEEPAVWGIDLAKSVDWTVALALDKHGYVCRLERWQAPWQETIAKILDLVGEGTAFVDSTGVGDPVVEALQRSGVGWFEGVKFSTENKQRLMERLSLAIARREIHFPEGFLVQELREFEYQYTPTGVKYSAPEGLHDDGVCALALAVYGRDHLPSPGIYV